MLKFVREMGDNLGYEAEAFSDDPDYLARIPDYHIRQIVEHILQTTRCLLNYAYINNIDIEGLDECDQDYEQAKATWELINACRSEVTPEYLCLIEDYSDKIYLYCTLLWNCAYQILMNKSDV